MQESSKRPSLVALTALIISIMFFLGMLVLSMLNNSFAVFSLAWLVLSSAIIWLVLTCPGKWLARPGKGMYTMSFM